MRPTHKLIVAAALTVFAISPTLGAEPYLYDLLKRPAYKQAWSGMLSTGPVPDWVSVFTNTSDGVAIPSTPVTIQGVSHRFASVCKPHECPDNDLNVIFGPDGHPAWALLHVDGKISWLGRPDEGTRAVLMKAAARFGVNGGANPTEF